MTTAIVFIAGPLQGASMPLGPMAVTVGRDGSNVAAIPDHALSRRHCRVELVDGVVTVIDLESLNGTFVNGERVQRRVVSNGDVVRVGASLMVLVAGGDEDRGGSPLDPSPPRFDSTIVLRPEEGRYSSSVIEGRPIDHERRIAAGERRRLLALLSIGRALHDADSVDGLVRTIIELVSSALAPARGAIALANPDAPSGMTLHRSPGTDAGRLAVNDAAITLAMTTGAATLSDDRAAQDGARQGERGAEETRDSSVICAPLTAGARAIGALYVSRSSVEPPFVEDDLQFAAGAGEVAGLLLDHALRTESLEREMRRLRDEAAVAYNMVGDSDAVASVRRFISRASPSDSTVLLLGESGVGKELVARAVHGASRRAAGPFVAINCAALTPTLLESELFGHERGAFTGAVSLKRGKVEVADGGTLFLDEVGDLALEIQAKLLRVLQESTFERVGGLRPIKVSVRVIAATNRDLDAARRAGAFREDLYYRLNVVSITVPSLRERKDDIPLLAAFFLRKYAEACKRRVTGISPEAQRCLVAYAWPGNVRELQNAIERAVVLGADEVIRPEDLPDAVVETGAATKEPLAAYHDAINAAKRQVLLNALQESGGRYTEAARLLGLQVTYMHRLVRNLGLRDQVKKA